jgi:hypothetical protein
MLGVPRARLGRGDPVLERSDEPLGLIQVQEMAGAGEDFEPAAGDELMGAMTVPDGEDPIALSPEDQQRHLRGQVQPVGRLHALAGGSTSSAPGSVAARRKLCTREPRPPLATSARRSVSSGN